MKKFYKFLSVVAIVAFMAGCAKEQSSFNVEDISGAATIKGSYHYNVGMWYDYELEEVKTDPIPLAKHTVYAEVSNSSLKDGANGVTVYEAITDAKGNFTISIPATHKGVSVKIYPKSFIGIYRTKVLRYEYNEPVFEEFEAVYEGTKQSFTVYPNDIKFHDVTLNYTSKRTTPIN